jgi:hypothetical protein
VHMRSSLWLVNAVGALAICMSVAEARTLSAGTGKEFPTPSAAIAAARTGDVVHIAAGRYFDCAIVAQDRIMIEGEGPESVLTDKTCGGKALLVIDGKDVTVRNLTLQRARVPDGNGAGIRAEGGNLTIENVRFVNNQDGILAADNPEATLRVVGSEFIDNGSCQNGGGCAHGIYVNKIALLHIEKSRFFETKEGHHIKSKALRTEIINTTVEDGPEGTSSYLVDIPIGGNVLIERNSFEKGPNCTNHTGAISIGEEGVVQPTDEIIVRNNHFRNDMDRPTIFVRNITATPAELVGNTLEGKVRPLEGDGSSR